MEWFTSVAGSLSGLPWGAVLVVILVSIACTKGVDALIKVWKARREDRQYDHAHEKTGYDALVEELKNRIEKLEGVVEKQSDKLDAATKAHADCEVKHALLSGQVEVMKQKIARLEDHDAANKKQKQVWDTAIEKIAKGDSAITPVPPELKEAAEQYKADTE